MLPLTRYGTVRYNTKRYDTAGGNLKQPQRTLQRELSHLSVDPQLRVEPLYAFVQDGVLLVAVGVTGKPLQYT